MKVGFLSRISVWLTELSDESCQGGTFALPDKTAKIAATLPGSFSRRFLGFGGAFIDVSGHQRSLKQSK